MTAELKAVTPVLMFGSKDSGIGENNDVVVTFNPSTDNCKISEGYDGVNSERYKVSSGGTENYHRTCAVNTVDGPVASRMLYIQETLGNFHEKYNQLILYILCTAILIAYFVYLGFALDYEFGSEPSYRLLIGSVVVVVFILLRLFLHIFGGTLKKTLWQSCVTCSDTRGFNITKNVIYYSIAVGFSAFVVIFVIVDVGLNRPRNLISAVGIAVYILLFYIFSTNPARVKWRPVFWGLAIQFALALFILRWKVGYQIFKWLGDRVGELLSYSDAGAIFLFGNAYTNHFFAFKVLPIIVFFSTLISMLYYLGAMQFVIRHLARAMAMALGTSPAESLNAAGNIFIGQSEAPLMIRPFLKDMTASEMHAICTGGMATIAGSVMATYILYGVPANHLISASVMSAPAALAMSKLFCPETEESKAKAEDVYNMAKGEERNIIEAASNGASQSIKLIANIAVNLIAFLSLLAFVNATLTWFGERIGLTNPKLTFELISSYVFFPFGYLMGVEYDDCLRMGELIGKKAFLNEYIAYVELSKYIKNAKTYYSILDEIGWNGTGTQPWEVVGDYDIHFPQHNTTLVGGILHERSVVISTYALCGFSNIGSMGVMLGALSAMAPNQKSTLSRIILRSMIAANVACFLTACIAGLLYKGEF